MWTALGDTYTTASSKLHVKCSCGTESYARVSDILAGQSNGCRPCCLKQAQLKKPLEERIAHATRASCAAAKINVKKLEERRIEYPFWDVVHSRIVGAKGRCTNKKAISWRDYGGRGIEFRFPTIFSATEWVCKNLGQPKKGMSLDRIDNNGHYEPGNLRWATRSEQNRNKRVYKVCAKGARIRKLQPLRPDCTYETLRSWINQGKTDEEILNRRKYEYN